MTMPLSISAEPVDRTRCKFVLNRVVGGAGVKKYASMEEADGSPVAQAVLCVPGVCEVVVSGNVLTAIASDDAAPWHELEPQVRYAIETVLTAEAPAQTQSVSDDDAIYAMVDEIFRAHINPAIASHGGQVELIDVQDATVVLRMMGGCQGCGMANVTLRQGIEASLKRVIPTLRGVRDITDHSSGTNPYFTAGSK